MNKKTKGISLIVLVITIIVMIIIAGAIILSLSNGNVISKAKEARDYQDFTQIREMMELEKGNAMYPGEVFDATDVGVINAKIPSKYTSNISITTGGTPIIIASFTDPLSTQRAIEKLDAVYIPTGFIASTVVGENTKEDGLVIYEGTNGNPTQTAVNAFVWIPVENISNFYKVSPTNFNLFNLDSTVGSLSFKTGEAGEDAEYNAMLASVTKYKGFYIARYEAGNLSSNAISRKTATVYNSISWVDSKTKSRAMYPSGVTPIGSPVSTLIFKEQWDAAMRFMKDVPNITNPANKYITDSTNMGVYSGGAPTTTGSNANYRVKNVYDMAGNVSEWTMHWDSNFSVSYFRGGFFGIYGAASSNYYMGGLGMDTAVGFRPALYIK